MIVRRFLIILIVLISCKNTEEKLEYYDNGNVKSKIVRYEDGKLVIQKYDSLGIIQEESNYYNGLPHGESKYFDSLGNLVQTTNFSSGIPHGQYVEYYSNNVIKVRGVYINGLRHDTVFVYDPSSDLRAINIFKEDQLVLKQIYGDETYTNLMPKIKFNKSLFKLQDTIKVSFTIFPESEKLWSQEKYTLHHSLIESRSIKDSLRYYREEFFQDSTLHFDYLVPNEGEYLIYGYLSKMDNSGIVTEYEEFERFFLVESN